MKIQSKRLTMEQIAPQDWPLYQALNQDPDVIRLCFDPLSPEAIKESFESRLPQWSKGAEHFLCLTVTLNETQEKIGVTGFKVSDGIAEVGYLFLSQHHGLGYGTESLRALVQWAAEHLQLESFNAVVTEGNIGSEKVLTKTGFVLHQVVPDAYQIGGKLYADHIYRLEKSLKQKGLSF